MSIHIGTCPHPWEQGVRNQLAVQLAHYLNVNSFFSVAEHAGNIWTTD